MWGEVGVPFPKNFVSMIKTIFKRLFRVYAHIYHSHFQMILALGLEYHLNTCFKHFIFFIDEFAQQYPFPYAARRSLSWSR